MQIRIEIDNAESIRIIKRERLKVHRKKDSAAEIANELIRKALMMITLPKK